MIVKIEDKVREKDTFLDVEKFLEEHGEELPFADPEPVKKPSVIEKLKEEKEKSEMTKSTKPVPDKGLREAI